MKSADIPDQVIIDACNAFHAGLADAPDVVLAAKYPPKVVLAKMQNMHRRRLLEYGVSLRTAWVVRRPGGEK